ncbi:MAG: AMP-binding protein [Actinobacteria bacterium]|nr:AMP-binding protein [Actinomycetota bacterium]
MGLTFAHAVAAVTAPGARFELGTATIAGRELPVFHSTPPSLRALFDSARTRDGTFLVYEDEQWSFAAVMDRVDAFGAMLVERYGVGKGDRVAIAMRNYPEWIVAFAAITSIGAVAVCLNAWWTTDELEYGLDDSGASVLVADAERVERVAPLLATGRTGTRVVAVRTTGDLPAGIDRLEDVLVYGAPLPDVDIDLDDDATILYTSGTTGHPKGAVSTHRAVLSALFAFGCRAAVNALMTDGDAAPAPYPAAFILIVPLFHVTGCVAVMLSTFASGAKLVMMHKWDPERALELIERERVTNFVGVPTMSWDLLESPSFATRDTSSLLAVGGGGAPAPPELVKRIDNSFTKGRPNIGYGMTETNAYGPQNSGDDYVRKPASAGRTVPIMQVRVVGPDGNVLGAGEVGEIEFRGANLIRGYWNKPEDTAEAFHDGWLRTGDLGRIDDEGFVYVEDRAKDMVLRGGENVYCAEIEAVIYEHPAVYEAAVYGVPHARLGEEVVARVVLREGSSLTADELAMHVASRLAAFKVPTIITFSNVQLPRSATGKILKRELRDQHVS